jgi:hypothetical protein
MRDQFRRIGRTLLLAAAAAAAAPVMARAQSWPGGPLVVDLGGAGRIVAGGEVSAAAGQRDTDAFFNYTGYEHNVLRMVRIALAARWQPFERAALLADMRSENFEAPRLYALYARVRPFARVPLDVQAGRIPPVFGRFARQAYAADNPLIGYPLAYQYLTSLRSDAVPSASEDLLRMRGRGWLASYPIGNREPGPGVPLVSAFRYDTGVQARFAPGAFEIAAAVTKGSLAEPGVNDEGLQVAARAAVTPVAGLVAGLSAARGRWLQDAVIPPGDDSTQRAIGADLEYSRDHWLVRGEFIASQWQLPYLASPVTARSGFIEARWRVRPRWFIAGRADRLTFSTLRAGGVDTAWDAPVTRVEAGGGWYFQRNLVAKIAAQHNWRDGGRIRQRTFVSAQILFWF